MPDIIVRDYPLAMLRGGIGMVLQDSLLFTGTIRDNIRWGREDSTEEEILEAARAAQAPLQAGPSTSLRFRVTSPP